MTYSHTPEPMTTPLDRYDDGAEHDASLEPDTCDSCAEECGTLLVADGNLCCMCQGECERCSKCDNRAEDQFNSYFERLVR